MIPKKIHYCWFGNNPKSKLILECIASWEKYCPDFEITEWNENNTKHYRNKFFNDALRKNKFAFASDCIRAKVLMEFGGIYLDTDMLLLKEVDATILRNRFFSAFEVENRVSFGFFGGVKNHRFFKKMVDFYDTTEFNQFSPPVITHTFQPLINKGAIREDEIIYDPELFYPLPYENREEDYRPFVTDKSYAVHLWDHSWKTKSEKELSKLLNGLKVVLIDFLFYNYSKQYFIRYFRGFSRQLYHMLKQNI